MKAPAGLTHANGWILPRVTDRGDWIYLDTCAIRQDDWGVQARMDVDGQPRRVYLPTANVNALLLGPGVSITTRALHAITASGAAVITVGAGGTRTYTYTPASRGNTDLIARQAEIHSNKEARLQAAQRLYRARFPGIPLPPELTLGQLRGMEGQRMRQAYRRLADQHKVPRFKRSYDPHDFPLADPVNQALSAANACLYGITAAATVALGCSPALGFIHTGHPASFIYDIADSHKADTTIPLAFSLKDDPTPAATARRRLHHTWALLKKSRAIIDTIHLALGDIPPEHSTTQPMVGLWDGDDVLPAGRNYGTDE